MFLFSLVVLVGCSDVAPGEEGVGEGDPSGPLSQSGDIAIQEPPEGLVVTEQGLVTIQGTTAVVP